MAQLSSSGVSSCYSEMDSDRHTWEESDEEEDAFITFTTTESKCELLFEQGLEFKHRGNLHESLSSFLKCLEGMQECQYFAKLPQTLHQLSDVYQSLQHLERAENYSKAEKLFYEVMITEPQASKESRQKTKRKTFGKKPKPASSAAYNPAEYGNLLKKKAEGFERLARNCFAECKFDLAQEYCSKASSIRQTVLGQKSYIPMVGCVSGIHSCLVKGDLSKASTVYDGPSKSGGTQAHLFPTTGHNEPPYWQQYPPDMAATYQQTENTSFQKGSTPFGDNTTKGACETTSYVKSELCSNRGAAMDPQTQEAYKHCNQECRHANIQRAFRQEDMNGIHEVSTQDGVQRVEQLGRVLGKGIGSRSYQEINLCAGVTNNLSKLSELKNPMCVNLDLHKGRGEGVEPTRCLPLWILLLPAFLALVGYVMYYH